MARRTSAKKSSKFKYKGREAKTWDKNASAATSSGRDNLFEDKVTTFYTPKDGFNRVRILPPAESWQDLGHYGVMSFIHYGIGPDNGRYFCPDSAGKGTCPICEERAEAAHKGDDDYAKELRATKRCAVWIIDRDSEDKGPQLWLMPTTVDGEICSRAVDRTTHEVLNVDDPENGYDIEFNRTGTGMTTKYVAVEIARRSSPVSDDDAQFDEWLEFVTDAALPDMMIFKEYEYIKTVFSGAAPKTSEESEESEDDEDDEDDEDGEEGKEEAPRQPRASRKKKEDDDPLPPEDPEDPDGDDLPTYAEVMEATGDALDEMVDKHELDIDTSDFDTDEELAAAICEALNLTAPKRGRARLSRVKGR